MQGEVLDVELFDQSLCIFIVPVKVFPMEVRSTYIHLTFVINPTSTADFLKPFWNNQQQAQLLCKFFILRRASIHTFESPLLPARGLPSWSWLEDLLGFGLLSVTLVCHFHKQVFGEQNS